MALIKTKMWWILFATHSFTNGLHSLGVVRHSIRWSYNLLSDGLFNDTSFWYYNDYGKLLYYIHGSSKLYKAYSFTPKSNKVSKSYWKFLPRYLDSKVSNRRYIFFHQLNKIVNEWQDRTAKVEFFLPSFTKCWVVGGTLQKFLDLRFIHSSLRSYLSYSLLY